MSPRRDNGTGSVYQRGDGRWLAAVSIDGKRVVKYAPSEREARRLLTELLVQQRQGQLAPPSKLTLGEWAGQWLALIESELRPSTLRTYRQVLTPITADIGKVRLDKLTPLALSRTLTRLQQQGIGPRRIQLGYMALTTCLGRAVELSLLTANPMQRVRKPKWDRRERQYWSVEQAQSFIGAGLATERKWGPLLVFLLGTGLRISEALGLEWADVDTESRHLMVRRALVWAGKEWHLLPPKTAAGQRRVGLTEAALSALLRCQPEAAPPDEPIFRTAGSRPPRPEHLRLTLAELCEEAGVPRINVHGLRHVAAMLAFEASGDPYAVQRRLGHATVGITMGVYAYTTRSDGALSGAIDALLGADPTAGGGSEKEAPRG